MAEELRNNMQKMDEDDLFSVSGGVSVHNRQRPNVGTYTHVDQTVLSGVAAKQNPAGSSDMKGFIGNMTEETASSVGLGSTTVECPACGVPTVHIIFNGGRGKCTVCGLVRDKL